jgi:thiosulfate dehydrogenase
MEIILGNIEDNGAVLPDEPIDSIIYPSLLSMFAESEAEIILWLDGTNNPDHDFSTVIPRSALKDLSAFLSVGMVAPNLIADPATRQVNGAGAQGEDLYKGKCLQCHGVDGAKINFGTVEQPWFLGNIAANNPWWASHIVRFGHPQGQLKAGDQINITFDRHTDLLAYMQILPSAQSRLNRIEVVVDYEKQADTILLTYMAIGLSGVVFGGVGWVLFRERRGQPPLSKTN